MTVQKLSGFSMHAVLKPWCVPLWRRVCCAVGWTAFLTKITSASAMQSATKWECLRQPNSERRLLCHAWESWIEFSAAQEKSSLPAGLRNTTISPVSRYRRSTARHSSLFDHGFPSPRFTSLNCVANIRKKAFLFTPIVVLRRFVTYWKRELQIFFSFQQTFLYDSISFSNSSSIWRPLKSTAHT